MKTAENTYCVLYYFVFILLGFLLTQIIDIWRAIQIIFCAALQIAALAACVWLSYWLVGWAISLIW